MTMSKARRYNKGKLRYELIPVRPLAELAKVYTNGAHKYSLYQDEAGNIIKGEIIPIEEAKKYELVDDGANNWRKGMSWVETAASAIRHIQDWMAGKDLDELGTHPLANAAWNCFTLMEYQHTHPEMDDRPHAYLQTKRIGLDIDGVLANFTHHIQTYLKRETINDQTHWNDPWIRDNFKHIAKDAEFWRTIPPLITPSDIQFEPTAYITARSIDPKVTQEWLDRNGFPKAPLYCVGHEESKIEIAKKAGIEFFVDDKYENFLELTRGGIFTYLMDAPYNRAYDVGFRRIHSLKEIS